MALFSRLANGWKLAMASFSVLKKHKQLIIFPIISGIALLFLCGSFFIAVMASYGWNFDSAIDNMNGYYYIILFGFYLVNYIIVVFFNMALIHCARLYFEGQEPSLEAGLKFSMSRLGVIFSWAILAATVGLLLNVIQSVLGKAGQLVAAIIGIVWSVATFFVIPVIAYENERPLAAIKRSSAIMKQKWGESLGANFSFGIVQIVALLVVAIPAMLVGMAINPLLGILLFILAAVLLFSIISAAQIIFISAVYHHIQQKPTPDFDTETLDGIFVEKKKNSIF